MSIVTAGTAERSTSGVVLKGIHWPKYLELRDMPENYNLRMTFDHGELEIMSPSRQHEVIAALIGSLIDIWTVEFQIVKLSCRTMTIRRKDLDLGFEPDNCYYVQNQPNVFRKRTKLNFQKDPPPDLAIEVEKSRSSKSKMQIYEAFGVPELWRIIRHEIHIFELSAECKYEPRSSSICFPGFPVAHVNAILQQYNTVDETTLLRSFRDWIRTNFRSGVK